MKDATFFGPRMEDSDEVMVNIKILSGRGCIGGNFIRIEDKDRILIFDQGVRFDVITRYYSGLIAPRGLHELRGLGAIPRVEWYLGASAIYISHMHIDHLGLLANVPARAKVFLPSLEIYEIMEKKWQSSPTWLSMVPRKYYVELEELRPLEIDENNVLPLPVSHSAFPAFAFLYFGSDETVLYTGDFRLESFPIEGLNMFPWMLDYLRENRDIKVDKLVIEGTNLGSQRAPISPREEESMFRRILEGHSLAVVTMHPLDAEYALFTAKIAADTKRPLYIASDEAAKLMERIIPPTEPKTLSEYVKAISNLQSANFNEVEKNAIIITSYRDVVDLLRDMSAEGMLPPNATAILSESEPHTEEAQEYAAIRNWFARLGVQAYAMRVSGHYYPHQIRLILETIKPKKVELIHSNQINMP